MIFNVPRDDKLCPEEKDTEKKQKAYGNCMAVSRVCHCLMVLLRTWTVNLWHSCLKSHVSTFDATPYFHDKTGHCKTNAANKHQFHAGAL
jgi:hypothetical protein